MIQDLAITASIGVATIILTNLVLLPVLMSFITVSKRSVDHARKSQQQESRVWQVVAKLASPKRPSMRLLPRRRIKCCSGCMRWSVFSA
ncbi:hypothetical protein [Endozoicomonas acroporae]|uniref:hypothetical protein n=1 Tax=Endozoicomonas acroporae TaxID=1701104 RepID=UPI003D7BFC34